MRSNEKSAKSMINLEILLIDEIYLKPIHVTVCFWAISYQSIKKELFQIG